MWNYNDLFNFIIFQNFKVNLEPKMMSFILSKNLKFNWNQLQGQIWAQVA